MVSAKNMNILIHSYQSIYMFDTITSLRSFESTAVLAAHHTE